MRRFIIYCVISILFMAIVLPSLLSADDGKPPAAAETKSDAQADKGSWISPSEEAMKAFYKKYYEDLALPKMVAFDIFQSVKKDEIDKIQAALKSSSFDELAKKKEFDGPYQDWELRESDNYFARQPILRERIFRLKPGEITEVLTEQTVQTIKITELKIYTNTYYSIVRCLGIKEKKYLPYEEVRDKIFAITILANPEINYDIIDPAIEAKARPEDVQETYKWIKYDDSDWCGNCAEAKRNRKTRSLFECFDKLGDYRRAARYWLMLRYFDWLKKEEEGKLDRKPYVDIDAKRIFSGSLITVSNPKFNWLSAREAMDASGIKTSDMTINQLIRMCKDGLEHERRRAVLVLGRLAKRSGGDRFSTLDSKAYSDLRPMEMAPELRQEVKECIFGLATDKSVWVRETVAEALGMIGEEDAITVLLAMQKNEPDTESSRSVKKEISASLDIYREDFNDSDKWK